MHRTIKRQRIIVGRLVREIDCKTSAINPGVRTALGETLGNSQRIVAHSAQRKAGHGQPKLYAWRAPELDCISKGKARRPDEFGVKAGIANTFKGNLLVGARAFHCNPYYGHTLNAQLKQLTFLMQDCASAPSTVFVDLGGLSGRRRRQPGSAHCAWGKPTRLRVQEEKAALAALSH